MKKRGGQEIAQKKIWNNYAGSQKYVVGDISSCIQNMSMVVRQSLGQKMEGREDGAAKTSCRGGM